MRFIHRKSWRWSGVNRRQQFQNWKSSHEVWSVWSENVSIKVPKGEHYHNNLNNYTLGAESDGCVPFWKCWPLSDSRGRCSCSCCSARLRRLARPVKQTSDQLTLTTRSHVSVSDSASHSPAHPTAGGASSRRGGRAHQRGWIHWAGWARYTDIQTQRMNFGARLKQADATFFSVEVKAERCCVLSAVTQLMDFHINNQ